MPQGRRTAISAGRDGLRTLLSAESRRFLRGLGESQLVFLRFFPSADGAFADAAALLGRCAQECDTVICLDDGTAALHMPASGQAQARACLRKALAAAGGSREASCALLATLPAGLWDSATPAQVLKELSAQLALCAPGAATRHFIVREQEERDEARVSAAERSFLLSPLP
ncbi:MAG: hypothetical protein Q4F72_04840 [Desulfovibrionaceae bacterium]|nr:hypothetical protein [Desulfovibrionaceae bacterium]